MGMREEIRVHLCAQKLYKFRENNCNSNFTLDTTAGSIEESYRIQDLLKSKYLKEGINICGWKAGIVSTRMQRIISSDQTFLSPIFKINNIENNCNLDYKKYVNLGLEVEILCKINSDIITHNYDWTLEDTKNVIESISLAIELVDTLNLPNIKKNLPLHIANFGNNLGFVSGKLIENWSNIDLLNEEITIFLNDTEIEKLKLNYMGLSPILVAKWMLSNLKNRRVILKKGDYLLLGCLSQTLWINENEKLNIKSNTFGELSLSTFKNQVADHT